MTRPYQQNSRRLRWASFAACLVLTPGSIHAADRTWENVSSDFNTAGNWVENAAPGAGDLGLFGTGTVVNPVIDTSQSILGLYYSGTSAYSLTAGGGSGTKTLTILSSGIVNDSSVQQSFASGTRTLAIAIGATTAFTANGTGSLYFNSNMGNISIGNNFTLTLNGNSSTSSTIAETITDSSNNGKLTKSGSGTWVLSANSSYGGATTLSDGVLSVSNLANGGTGSHIGNSSNAAANLVFDGGTLRHTAAAADSTNRSFTITAGKTAVIDMSDAAGNLTISGAGAATTGGLTKIGAGTLTLSGANAYTGDTSIGTAGGASGGTLTLGNNERLSNSSTVNVYAGTFNVNSRTETISGLNLGGGADNTTAAVTMTSGTLTLGGNLTYNATNDPEGATITGGTLALGANRTFTIGDTAATTTDLAISSVVSGASAGINKQGAGTLQLSGTNTYTGVTTLTAGTLSVATIGNGGVAGNLGQATNAASNLIFNGGTLQYTGATASTNRSFTLTNATTGTIDVSSGAADLTVSGSTTATTGALTKTGAGTLTLTGTNLHSGTTTISAGTLNVGNGGTTGTLGSGSVVNNAALVINRSNAITLAGDISGTGTLTQSGTGTTTLAGTNTYTGLTTVANGTLKASGNNSLGATTGNITVSAGGTLALDGGTNITRSGTLTLNGTGTSGTVGALHAAGGTGTTSQWTGSTTINTASTITAADNLLIIGNGASGQFNTTTLTLNAGVTFHTPNAASVVPTYLPVPSYVMDPTNIMLNSFITGTGGITKTGDGTLSIIRGTSFSPNNFTGDTVVTGGTLLVDGPSNKSHLSSTNIFVGNSGSANNDSVVLLMGQATGSTAGNNILGVYNAVTNASDSNLTVYEDGLFNMNRGSNGFINLTLQGGHVNGVGSNPLLTLSGSLFSKASAQTGLIENNNLGIGSSKLTVDVESGTTSSGVDLQIDSKIQQGVGYTAVASGTALEKTGLGKVVLTGVNTYGGITDIVGGTLNIQNASALGQNSVSFGSTNHGTTVQSGAQLQLQGGITVENETLTLSGLGVSGTGALRNFGGDNTYNGYVFLAADSRINADAGTNLVVANPGGLGSAVINGTSAGKNLIVGGNGNTTVNGAIVGNISNITKDGTGTLTLAGYNTYVGAVAVQAGALRIIHSNALSGSGVTVSSGAALQFAQNDANQDIAAVGIASTISGTGLSNGGAIQNLDGANSYSGGITLAANSRITADSGSSLALSGNVTGAGFALDAGGVGNTTYSGAIGGPGTALTKTDSGTVTLSGTAANTFTGGTTVSDGTLALNKSGSGFNSATGTGTLTIGNGVGAADSAVVRLDASNQINDTAAVVLASDGRLNLNSFTDTVGSIAGSGEIIMGTGQLIAGGNNSSTTFDGTLHGASSAILNKEGTGTLTIGSNVNAVAGDFAGTLNLNAGTLAFNVDNAFTGTVNVAVSAGGTTLKLSNADVNVNNLNFTGSGSITLDFSGTSSLSATNLTIAAGVTVNIINWTDATDYFFATNWSGATQDLTGQAPMNYVVFQGWVGDNTKWQSYDDQITPVPEPSTYGAMLVGAMGAFLGWRRHRRNKSGAAK